MFERILVRFRNLTILQITTILVLAVFVVYLNSFSNKLLYDDEDFIYKNEYVKNINNLPKYFYENSIAGSGKISNYYRPILLTTFGFEYSIFQDLPFIYHFNSTLLQITNSVLVFFFIFKLFKRKSLAFITALLFGIHPIQTEAVSYVSGRGDPLSFMFMMATILLFMKSDKTYLSKPYILALFSFLLALLSKEITIITPLLLVLVLLTQGRSLTKKALINAFKRTLPFFVTLGIYLLLRLTIFNFQNTLNFYGENNVYTSSLFVRLLTFASLLPDYLMLLIFPWNLFMERSGVIITSLNIKATITILMVIFFFALSIKYFRIKHIFFFSLSWFFICFIPTSGIIPINGIFYEHFLYFPSLGFFLLISQLLIKLFKVSSDVLKLLIGGVFLIYLLFLAGRTINRNFDWHDPITFYNQTLKNTESARVRNNLAMAYAEDGNFKNSISQYKKSILLYDYYPETHYNLGNSYLALGQTENATQEYEKAIKVNKFFYHPYLKLYDLYSQSNDLKAKEKLLSQIKKLSVENPTFKYVLSQIQN